MRARESKPGLHCGACGFHTRKTPTGTAQATQEFVRQELRDLEKKREALRCPNPQCKEGPAFGIRTHLRHPKRVQDIGCAICGFRTQTFKRGKHDWDADRHARRIWNQQQSRRREVIRARAAIQAIPKDGSKRAD